MIQSNKKQEIKNIVEKLKLLFPQTKCIDDSKLKKFFENRQFASMISLMKNHMGIQCQLNVKCITDGKLKTKAHGCSIPAWVNLPQTFPLFGSIEQRNMKITLTFHKETSNSYYSFVQMIAHELSHIVLHSINHPLRTSEVATDIAAIMLGFSKYYEIGHTRIFEDSYSQLGYLSFEEMMYVISLVEGDEEFFKDNKNNGLGSRVVRYVTNFFNKLKQSG